ncbi:MAG: hypothetical protein ACYDHD_08495 [Vulcanimicrobiaceae bacterium]
MTLRRSWLAGAVALLVSALVAHGRSTPYDNYVLLAQAFLHGHAWINWPGPYIDALAYGGRHYIIEAPFPALLLMPVVAVFGGAVNQTWLALLLAGVSIGALWEFGERIGLPPQRNVWLCAFALAGTDLLWAAMLGDVWFLAHVSAVCFTLLALVELAGKRRGWLVAIYACAALESRFTFLLALPIYAYLLITDDERPLRPTGPWLQRLGSFLATLAPIALLWVWYNQARWGTWYDIGYTAWYHQDPAGLPYGSPFRLEYLPYQLWSYFVQAPQFIGRFPWIVPSLSGVALTWTSPALVLAFFARRPLRMVIALWVGVVLLAGPNFIYYVNGFAQFGMRHALDFEPLLFALMAYAMRDWMPKFAYVLIAYSVAVGLWGCWFWNAFIRPAN